MLVQQLCEDEVDAPKPIVVKGYGRCCQGNYRAHMRIPDATTFFLLMCHDLARFISFWVCL